MTRASSSPARLATSRLAAYHDATFKVGVSTDRRGWVSADDLVAALQVDPQEAEAHKTYSHPEIVFRTFKTSAASQGECLYVALESLPFFLAATTAWDMEPQAVVEEFHARLGYYRDSFYNYMRLALFPADNTKADDRPESVPASRPADVYAESFARLVETVTALSEQVGAINARQAKADAAMSALPPPAAQVPPVTQRVALRRYLNNWMIAQYGENPPQDYRRGVWHTLYAHVRDRLGVDARVRAKHLGVTALEVLDREGLVEQAYAIARSVFPLLQSRPKAGSVFDVDEEV